MRRYLQIADYLELIPTETGFHALARFRRDFDERRIEQLAMQADLLVRPLSNYCIEPLDSLRGIALGYGCVSPSQIEDAAVRLRQVFAAA